MPDAAVLLPLEIAAAPGTAAAAARRRRALLSRRACQSVDGLAVVAAIAVAQASLDPPVRASIAREALALVVLALAAVAAQTAFGRYRPPIGRRLVAPVEPFATVRAATLSTIVVVATSALSGLARIDASGAAVVWAATVVCLPLGSRSVAATLRRVLRPERVVVAGGDAALTLAGAIAQHDDGAAVLAAVCSDATEQEETFGASVVRVPLDQLEAAVHATGADRLVVTGDALGGGTVEAVERLLALGTDVDYAPQLIPPTALPAARLLGDSALLSLRATGATRTTLALKRLIDIVGASLGLAITAPLFAYIVLRIRHESGGPALFRQGRLGAGMQLFTLLKFRTMHVGADDALHRAYIRQTMTAGRAPLQRNGLYKLDRDDAVTPFGRWLRRTSLDELPQLLNVLRGEMSLVGPRPCLPYEAELFEPRQLMRFAMPAGLTGLWQVTARARVDFRAALELDVAYVRNWSLALDLSILAHTPAAALAGRRTA